MNWQPIETAPLERTDVLLWTPSGQLVGYQYISGMWNASGVKASERECDVELFEKPTHWMPVPEDPVAKRPHSPENPPRCRRPDETAQNYRVAMGWDSPCQCAAKVAAERERCAQIVDPCALEANEARGGLEGLELMRELAAAIRAA